MLRNIFKLRKVNNNIYIFYSFHESKKENTIPIKLISYIPFIPKRISDMIYNRNRDFNSFIGHVCIC